MTRRSGGGIGLVLLAAAAVTVHAEEPARPGTEVARAVEPSGDVPYDPAGRRDPFRPPRSGNAAHQGEPRTPLQRYEIGQLRLVAVIYETSDPRAVVEDSEGLGYIVKVGTAIGPNGGQVRAIQRGRVVINEDSVDFYGEHRVTEVTMELRTAEREKK